MTALAEEHELTLMQLHTLYAILQDGNTMGKLACMLHCDASNVTGIVDRLVAQKLITRQESTQDRRAKTLELTNSGRRLMQEIIAQLPERLGCSRLTGSERAALHQLSQNLPKTA